MSTDSTVLVTQNGTFGDPGTGDSSWLIHLQEASLQRLLAGTTTVEDKLSRRQHWMGWSQPSFGGRANMSQVTGLDHTAVLPPYFPAGRGEDQIFGAMVEYLHPKSLVLNYAWAVPHVPFEERRGSALFRPERGSAASQFSAYLSEHLPAASGSAVSARLASLVALIRELVYMTDNELGAIYRSNLAATQTQNTRALSDKLRDAKPAHLQWRTLLKQLLTDQVRALGHNEVPVLLKDVAVDLPEQQIWAELRTLSSGFAEALQAWPEIRDAAAKASPWYENTGNAE